MLSVSERYTSLYNIMNEDDNYNWYSVRVKNAKGSVIIEFYMSVKDNKAGIEKDRFFNIIRGASNKSPYNGKSNLSGEHDYDKFEISVLQYLNKKLGEDTFRRVGGNSGEVSDLVLQRDNTFWVECKMNHEARAGQFTVKATEDRVTLNTISVDTDDHNVDSNEEILFRESINRFIDAAKSELSRIFEDECNKDPLKFFNYISQKEQIQINAAETDIVSYVKAHYRHKNVKYFIAGLINDIDNCIIVPLANLEKAFNIQAICRFKRYNAKVVPGGYSAKTMEMVYSALQGSKYKYYIDHKWYKNYGAVKVNTDKSSFEIEVPNEITQDIGIEGPITLVFDRKDREKISYNRQPSRKK